MHRSKTMNCPECGSLTCAKSEYCHICGHYFEDDEDGKKLKDAFDFHDECGDYE